MPALGTMPCRDAQTETYHGLKKWITVIVKEFYRAHRRHGVDFAEMRQEADVAFLEALPTWNPERAQLTTFLRIKVWDRLFYRFVRMPGRHQDLMPIQHGVDIETVPQKRFCTNELINHLSKDARLLVTLTLEGGAKTPDHLWEMVREELTARQFLIAFQEVKEAL